MANENLKGLKVAILIEDGFEQVEMVDPRRALDQAGAVTHIKPDDIPAFNLEMIDVFGKARRQSRQTA